MIREILENLNEAKPRVFRNERSGNWEKEKVVADYLAKLGYEICGIGLLESFFKARKDNEYIFVYLGKGEYEKGKRFDSMNQNPSEKLVRYASRNTVAGGMVPLCILNADKGYMRIMENIDEDPDIEDAQWSKPMKFNYLRTVY